MRAASMTQAYAGAARSLGAIFPEHTEVIGLRTSGSHVTGVHTAQGQTIACDHLLIAAGTWSPDTHPILGTVPGWENVTLATGHGGIGFESSAITGEAIAELILTGKIPEIIRAFGLERFRG